MQYKVTERKNPQDLSAPGKFYAAPVYIGTYEMDELARDIAERSSLTPGDVKSALENAVDIIPKLLQQGFIVSMGELGRFRLIPHSEGTDTEEEFSGNKIKRVHVAFVPSVEVKAHVAKTPFMQVQKV
ncbi:MAG: HU family DNA-binding protein [Treponemataceae bacterium]|nr:MAG: HU family DNA-binding protein [Treponemataceae bacterium]